jgi:hypothetical protein
MTEIDIPILKKSYDLYKVFHEYRTLVPKQDRYTLYERSENTILDILEGFFEARYGKANRKQEVLEMASVKLNSLRFLTRLMKDTRSLDTKKHLVLQTHIDEIGRMLGGWIRSTTK